MRSPVAVAGVAVALTLAAACTQTAGPRGAAPPARTPVPARTTGVASVVPPSPEAVTQQAVRRVLAATPTLPGGRPARRAPVPVLARPTQTVDSPNVVTATRWWTAPGTVPTALAHLRAHPPAGMRGNGSGTFQGPHVMVRSLTFEGRATAAYRELTLVVAVTRHGTGVAVRADAEAVWLPRRTAAEHIDPATLTSVAVTVLRPDTAPTVHRTLTGPRARALAAVVDRLPVRTPGVRSCFRDRGYVDTLVFHGAGPDVVVRVEPEGCMVALVSVAGRGQPWLTGGGTVDRAVVAALGLPRSYSR